MVESNPNAWNNWYHCVGSTYGTWLKGDPRGFRTRKAKQYVDGDYRNPPPAGVFAPMFEQSKASLKYPPVKLSKRQRQTLCNAMIERFVSDQVEVIALAVASNHFHLLARFPVLSADEQVSLSKGLIADGRDPSPRYYLTQARRSASLELSSRKLKDDGPVWAARPKCDPVCDRQHQVNVTCYIEGHAAQQAAVWSIRKK
jgi:hypothetical protein